MMNFRIYSNQEDIYMFWSFQICLGYLLLGSTYTFESKGRTSLLPNFCHQAHFQLPSELDLGRSWAPGMDHPIYHVPIYSTDMEYEVVVKTASVPVKGSVPACSEVMYLSLETPSFSTR